MRDEREPVTGAVRALVRLARGTAAGPGQAVAEVVRARLRLMPQGRRALAAVEASPGDPAARDALTAAVEGLLVADPAFAQYLATTDLGGPADPRTVQLRSGAKGDAATVQLRSGPASTGDPTTAGDPTTVQLRVDPAAAGAPALAARRGNTAIVVALVLVLITALVALGINLGSRPLLHPNGPDFAHAAGTIRDPARVRGVLPDAAALPVGWQVQSGPLSGAGSGDGVPCLLPDACDQQLAYATVTFRAAPVQSAQSAQSVQFTVVTFASSEAAGRAFGTRLGTDGADAATVLTVPVIGDQSAARVHGTSGTEALVRVGPALLHVRDDGPGAAAATPALVLLARLLAERTQQAQDGRTPDAALHGDIA
ncbi:hypothetical protein ABT247_13775 [Kitasatospora sp. NPDC001539]|uniref:hypothetical protein n=1 Tax=Kitasatospora sp. NPDC001539 TaxID=3154384 RepID=UPI003326ECA5